MNNFEKMNTNSQDQSEPTEAEKVLGSMPKFEERTIEAVEESHDSSQEIHDIYDDSYWEHKNPQSISSEDYAKLVGITDKECIENCKEAIYAETSKPIEKPEGKYWLLGGDDEETGFYGHVVAYPAGSKARFDIEGTTVHDGANGFYIYNEKFRK